MPSSGRGAVLALANLNIEMNRAIDNSNESSLINGKLEFWSDCIDNIYKV